MALGRKSLKVKPKGKGGKRLLNVVYGSPPTRERLLKMNDARKGGGIRKGRGNFSTKAHSNRWATIESQRGQGGKKLSL